MAARVFGPSVPLVSRGPYPNSLNARWIGPSGREELIRLPIGSRVGAGACATAGAFTDIGFGSDRTISATGACGRAGGAASLLAVAVTGGAIAKIGAGCGPGCR